METVGYLLALVAAAIHAYIFYLESIAWKKPAAHRLFGVREERDVQILTQVMFNQGFYNLFLAFGALGGALLGLGNSSVGRGLTLYCMTFMAGAALVLIGSNARMVRGALVQGLIPAVALVALLLG